MSFGSLSVTVPKMSPLKGGVAHGPHLPRLVSLKLVDAICGCYDYNSVLKWADVLRINFDEKRSLLHGFALQILVLVRFLVSIFGTRFPPGCGQVHYHDDCFDDADDDVRNDDSTMHPPSSHNLFLFV